MAAIDGVVITTVAGEVRINDTRGVPSDTILKIQDNGTDIVEVKDNIFILNVPLSVTPSGPTYFVRQCGTYVITGGEVTAGMINISTHSADVGDSVDLAIVQNATLDLQRRVQVIVGGVEYQLDNAYRESRGAVVYDIGLSADKTKLYFNSGIDLIAGYQVKVRLFN